MEPGISNEHSKDAEVSARGVEQARVFLSEVRNELKRVNWPCREVYATTVLVVVLSVALGIYLKSIEPLFDAFLVWLFRRFGVS